MPAYQKGREGSPATQCSGLTAVWTHSLPKRPSPPRPWALGIIYEVSGYHGHKVRKEWFLHFSCHEKQFNSVLLWHCLFSQRTGDLGLPKIICLSRDQASPESWEVWFDSGFLLLPSQLEKEALAFPIVPKGDWNPFYPGNCCVPVNTPDVCSHSILLSVLTGKSGLST